MTKTPFLSPWKGVFLNELFVRSGNANIGYGYLRDADIHGYYWAHGNSTSLEAYNFAFYNSGINQSNSAIYRYLGFSLRCLQE